MATAVTAASETKGSTAPAPLWVASLAGGVYVILSLAAVLIGVPMLWQAGLASALGDKSFFNAAGRLVAQAAAAAVLWVLGVGLAGPHPVKGLRGGIFGAISVGFTVFFLARAVGMWAYRWFDLSDNAAIGVFGVALAVFTYFGLNFLRGRQLPEVGRGAGRARLVQHVVVQARTRGSSSGGSR